MSWVCPMCSTNNEDSESKCIVCESARPAESVAPPPVTRTAPSPRPTSTRATSLPASTAISGVRTTPTPPSRPTPVRASTAKSSRSGAKTAARIFLMIIGAIIASPILYHFCFKIQRREDAIYSTAIGVALLYLLVFSIIIRFSGSYGKCFARKTCFIPTIILSIASLAGFIILDDSIKFINLILVAEYVIWGLIALIKAFGRSFHKYIPVAIFWILTVTLLAWRIWAGIGSTYGLGFPRLFF